VVGEGAGVGVGRGVGLGVGVGGGDELGEGAGDDAVAVGNGDGGYVTWATGEFRTPVGSAAGIGNCRIGRPSTAACMYFAQIIAGKVPPATLMPWTGRHRTGSLQYCIWGVNASRPFTCWTG
jgi:hypothetical protein